MSRFGQEGASEIMIDNEISILWLGFILDHGEFYSGRYELNRLIAENERMSDGK